MEISINEHSSIKINGSKIIYVDPYNIHNKYNDADLILITHDHYDHYDINSIKNIIKEDTQIIVPKSILDIVKVKFSTVEGMGVFDSINVMGINIRTIPSYNVNKEFHSKNKGYVGYIISMDGEVIYVAGDTDITKEAYEVSCDVALVPIGGTYTMDYREAARLINIIKPKVAIPIHYGSIVETKEDALNFEKLIDKDISVRILI